MTLSAPLSPAPRVDLDTLESRVVSVLQGCGWEREGMLLRHVPFHPKPWASGIDATDHYGTGRLSWGNQFARLVLCCEQAPLVAVEVAELWDGERGLAPGDFWGRPASALQRAVEAAHALDAPYACVSDGRYALFHDRTGESLHLIERLVLGNLPDPDALWRRFQAWQKNRLGLKASFETDALANRVEGLLQPADRRLVEDFTRLVATGQGHVFQVAVVGWTGPHTPALEWQTLVAWAELPTPGQFVDAVHRALHTPRFFAVCQMCSERHNTGHMHTETVCQGCAERYLGVVH